MTFTIRPEDGGIDRAFMRKLNARLVAVSEAPAHSEKEVIAFQDRFTASAWESSNENNTTLVAIDEGGQQLGYINIRDTKDEIANEKCGYIALLAVKVEAEGKGIAKALVSEAENWARKKGFHRLSLDVFASNHRGQNFYKEIGFQPETIRVIKRL